MIGPALVVEIRRLFEIEGWRPSTIARHLGVHQGTVQRALAREGIEPRRARRASAIDPFLGYLRETLERHPDLPASVLWEMVRRRGYSGGMDHFRHRVAELDLRPRRPKEAFLDLRTLPGEQAQVDWACIGTREVRGGQRRLLAFVMVLSFSRQLFVRFFHDERLPSLLAGHVFAFEDFGGVPRVILYDNPRTIVLERRGLAIRFQPRLLELADAYGFELRPVPPRRANEKGRVERAIRYLRSSFLPLRGSLSLAELNREIVPWCQEVAQTRPWPQDRRRTVAQAFAEERPRLVRLPPAPFPWPEQLPVAVSPTAQVRFDGNRYTAPPELVGRQLLLVADLDTVRLIDGAQEVASHPRSFERNQIIEDPTHTAAIRQAKRLARLHRGQDRLMRLVAEDFAKFLRLVGMAHVRTSPYYPQSNGKQERFFRSLEEEALAFRSPEDPDAARAIIGKYLEYYNHSRLHSALGYVAPWDFLEGKAPQIHALRDQRLEQAREQRRLRRQAAREISANAA